MKRYASHFILDRIQHKVYPHSGIEISLGGQVRFFPLNEEQEDVEWLPGAIELSQTALHQMALIHLYPFDVENVTERKDTQRRVLISFGETPHKPQR